MAEKEESFSVVVNFSMPFSEMIDVGNYDNVNSQIRLLSFPIAGSESKLIDIILFPSDGDITAEKVLVEMKQKRLRPATAQELLALGAAFPELQTRFSVVAFGSVWEETPGNRRVIYLGMNHLGRYVDHIWLEAKWIPSESRFAAVRVA